MHPPIHFLKTKDGVRIAYAVHGQGPPLVYVRGWVGHLELLWQDDAFRAFFEALGQRFTVVRYDARGNGLSDRAVPPIDLDALVTDLETVMDALSLDGVALYGTAFGGPIALTYAARHPERVSRLILDGTYARGAEIATLEWQARLIETLRAMPDAALLLLSHLTDPEARPAEYRRPPRFRDLISGEVAAQLYSLGYELDVTTQAAAVRAPTLVLHRRESRAIPYQLGRELAALIPDARFVALEGRAHNPWEGDAAAVLQAIGEFLDAPLELPRQVAPAPAMTPVIVLFTDLEGSTPLTRRLGDAGAQEVLRAHNAIVRGALASCGGAEIKHGGDGIMASLTSASRAVECAIAIQREVARHNREHAEMSFNVRIGLNAGEPIHEGLDLFGIAVILAERITGLAAAGEILVSDVVRQLCAGKGLSFADRGQAVPRGFDEPVRLYEVRWRPDET